MGVEIKDNRIKDYLNKIKDNSQKRQDEIITKINDGRELSFKDIVDYTPTKEEEKLMMNITDLFNGKPVEDITSENIKDFLSIAQCKVLIPKVMIDVCRKAADPVYLCSKFFKTTTVKNNVVLIRFPVLGVLKAHDFAEGQEIPEENADWNIMETNNVDIRKSGVRLSLTEELLGQCEFDILSILVSECGRALARWREEKAFIEFYTHCNKVFDNNLRTANKNYGTTGVDFYNNLNDTLSTEDILDLLIALYNNHLTPTDLLMHPIVWTVFAKNGLIGAYLPYGQQDKKGEVPNGSFKIGPESIQGRIPFAINVNLSPFAPINKVTKTYNVYAVDRDNVGMCLERNKVTTEKFDDPSRDITNIKFAEAYGYATINKGRAIAGAHNISMAKTYPVPTRYINI